MDKLSISAVKHVLIYWMIPVFFMSCVNSGMYKTEPKKVGNVQESTDENGYRYIVMDKSTGGEEQDQPLVKNEKKELQYQITSREVADTVVSIKEKTVQMPIDEVKKDSLLFALVKDNSLSQEQKDQKLRAFLKSYKKVIQEKDTSVVTKIVYDTVVVDSKGIAETVDTSNAAQTEAEEMRQRIIQLEEKLQALKEAESGKEKKQAKKEVKLSVEEIRRIAKSNVSKYYDKLPALLIPIAGVFLSFLLLFSPLAPLAALTYLGTLGSSIYFMIHRPNINWSTHPGEHKDDPEYRKAYVREAKRRNGLNALFGFIPAALILLFYVGIIILFLLLW